ncbi:MAG: NADH-quinone oxidoreductase subunit C [Candidatus Dormibacteraceae bacterium]
MRKKAGGTASLEALVVDRGVIAGDEWLTVTAGGLHEALTLLKRSGFDYLCFMSAVDHLPDEPRFELVYQLRNMVEARGIRVRCFVAGPEPSVPTVSDVFPPANWDERETWDLFGIRFEGHPDLTRLLLPDDWVGHPLRRDYPVGGEAVDFSEDHRVWQTAPSEA